MEEKAKMPENLVVVKPDEPSYDTLHLCIYMSELFDEMEKELRTTKEEQGKEELEHGVDRR